MANWRGILLVSLYIIWWPFSKLLNGIVLLLTPVWTLVSFILLPFTHLAQTFFTVMTFPFSVQWLERIETLYIYLGTAALVGCMTGAVIFIVFKLISSSLNIDSAIVPRPQDQGRTTTDFRAARREKQEATVGVALASTPVVLKRVPGSRGKGLLNQAIIEEEDSDF